MSRRTIHISLSPNLQRDDLLITLKTIFMPWRWMQQSAISNAHQLLNKLFPNTSVILTSSGRSALYHTLTALNIGRGDDVIIQAFTCIAVSSAVRWTGASPQYADIIPQTYNLDPASVRRSITPQTKAIVIQHTFGIPADLDRIKTIADEHDLILIEDLAHGLGSTYRGKALGTFGDVAIISFGRDKVLSCVFGGAIVVNNPKYIESIQKTTKSLTNPPLWWSLQQLFHPIITTISLAFYQLGLGKLLLYISQRVHLISFAVTTKEKQGKKPPQISWTISPLLVPLLVNQLVKLSIYQKHRQNICAYYESHILNHQSSPLKNQSCLRYPVRVANKHSILKIFQTQGIILGDWYPQIVTPCNDHCRSITGYQSGSCPQAEQAARETINLPTHIKLSFSDAKRITKMFQNIKLITPQ